MITPPELGRLTPAELHMMIETGAKRRHDEMQVYKSWVAVLIEVLTAGKIPFDAFMENKTPEKPKLKPMPEEEFAKWMDQINSRV